MVSPTCISLGCRSGDARVKELSWDATSLCPLVMKAQSSHCKLFIINMYIDVLLYKIDISEHLWYILCGALLLYPSRPDTLQQRQRALNCAIDLFVVPKESAEGRCEEQMYKGPFPSSWHGAFRVCWSKQAQSCLLGSGAALVSPVLFPESLIKDKAASPQHYLFEVDPVAALELQSYFQLAFEPCIFRCILLCG